MDLSEFVFRLLLLFLPGIICSYLVDTFTTHKERTQFQFVINSYLLGMIAYFSHWLFVEFLSSIGCNVDSATFLDALVNTEQAISFKEILLVCVISVLLAIIFIWIDTHKLQFKILRKLGITNKSGELDVWSYLMNSDEIYWIIVRDLENDLVYDGKVESFSETSKEAEILLTDVKVYDGNNTKKPLDEVAVQYLSLPKDKIAIEIRTKKTKKKQ